MADEAEPRPQDDLAHDVAQGRHEATPFFVVGGVALTIGIVVAGVTGVLLTLWIVL
jgi:hypothetical protein